MNFKCKSLSEKATCYVIQIMGHSRQGKTIEMVDQWFPGAQGKGLSK